MQAGAEKYSVRRLAGVGCGKFQETETAITGISFWTWMEIVFKIP